MIRSEKDSSPPSDRKLLEEWLAERDEELFAELVRRHGEGLYKYLVRKRRAAGLDLTDADDDWNSLWRYFYSSAKNGRLLSAWQEGDNLAPLLYQMARNIFLDAVRRNARRRETSLGGLSKGSPYLKTHDDLEAKIIGAQERERLRAAIGKLEAKDQNLFTLRIDEDLGFSEIAERLGISEKACRTRFTRLKSKLRSLL